MNRDLPWHDLFSNQDQSLEWFSADGKLLAREGSYFPTIPLAKNLQSSQVGGSPVVEYQDQIRIMTIAVYAHAPDKKTLQLQGYLRASQSIQRLEAWLNQLQLGLGLGGLIALLLASISSLYLTRQAVQPMRLSFQRLTRFASDAAHELRNPLTRISIATEIMLSHVDELKPSDVKKLAIITDATEQMRRLIDDVLFLAQTDAAYLPTMSKRQENTVCIDQLLHILVERFEPQAQAKGIHLRDQLLTDVVIKGNRDQLERLFSNLLENAVKYTGIQGKITLAMYKSKQSVMVSIEDTGIGIPTKYLAFIFQRFWRAEQARSQEDGFGLGLAIAQTIAKQHGGEITVNSQLGVGSRFLVHLPLQ